MAADGGGQGGSQGGGGGAGKGPQGGGSGGKAGGGAKGGAGEKGGGAPKGAGGDKKGGGAGAAASDEGRRHGAARAGRLGDRTAVGAHEAVQQARANFIDVNGRNAILDGTQGDVHLGDHHHYDGGRTGVPRLVSGAVPRDELQRLRRVFEEPPAYGELLELLKRQRLVALCGDPGSSRGYAALSLLDEVTHGCIERMDPRTELDKISESDLQEGHGYLVEITGEETLTRGRRPKDDDRDREERDRRWPSEPPAELHLDRLSTLLARRGAYAILAVGAGGFADELLRGRYGQLFRTPSADGMLRKHLVVLLGHGERELLEKALELARRPDVLQAIGLDPLRPHEVESLARLLVGCLKEEISEDELRAELRTFAHAQARAWFATTGRAEPRHRDAVAAVLRQAAFRTAVAVYNGSRLSMVDEAAEQLAWEFTQAMDPEQEQGRVLFSDHRQARLAAARAELFTGDVMFDGRRLETRKVRLQGGALARAVLAHVWEDYHNARRPLSLWLRTQCADGRAVVMLPAAITAGALCTLDLAYAAEEIVIPMASGDDISQRMAAATVFAQAAALSDAVRPIVRDAVREWARGEDGALVCTAALVHGFGTVEGSVSASLDELGRLAARADGDWDLLTYISLSVRRLIAGAEPETVLRRLGAWMGDRRTRHRDLALLTVDGLVWQHTSRLWGLEGEQVSEDQLSWPFAAVLLVRAPQYTPMLADLVWSGLDTARWREDLEISLADWMHSGEDDPVLLDVLCDFLPHLVSGASDAERLRNLVRRMERDPDEALSRATAQRLRGAIDGRQTIAVEPAPSGPSAEKTE
ncbi:hypothetical protein ACFWZ2_02935 [Streptomyces sp. NPDC059002]|uniref:hypothetical protein n=1 Tax=Streptomyces sp. NPDC059002 TaxID=3346690 RepID=UPI00368CFA21